MRAVKPPRLATLFNENDALDRLRDELASLPVDEKARRIMEIVFDGETDPAGMPYADHCTFVAGGPDFDADTRAVGFLHDVIEEAADLGWTAERLEFLGIPKHIITVVQKMTRPRGAEYFDHLEMHSDDPIYVAVKERDLQHNGEGAARFELGTLDVMKEENPTRYAKLQHKWTFVYPLAQKYMADIRAGIVAPKTPITDYMRDQADRLGKLATPHKLALHLGASIKRYTSHAIPGVSSSSDNRFTA